MEKLLTQKSISLHYDSKTKNSMPIKIECYLLELYSQKKYKTSYAASKEKVNTDIRKLSKKNDTKRVKDIKALITMELVSSNIKNSVKNTDT